METTIKINTDSIPPDFVEGIKKFTSSLFSTTVKILKV